MEKRQWKPFFSCRLTVFFFFFFFFRETFVRQISVHSIPTVVRDFQITSLGLNVWRMFITNKAWQIFCEKRWKIIKTGKDCLQELMEDGGSWYKLAIVTPSTVFHTWLQIEKTAKRMILHQNKRSMIWAWSRFCESGEIWWNYCGGEINVQIGNPTPRTGNRCCMWQKY